MKCRRMMTWTDDEGYSHRDIVWFGSYGKNEDGTAKFYDKDDVHDNYCEEREAIATTLTQQLSVLKNELWYNVDFGLPLFDKNKSKGIIDAYIVSTCLANKEVKSFKKFLSTINEHDYACVFILETIYGDLQLSI